MINLPKIDLTDKPEGSKEEFETELASSGFEQWIKSPGKYELILDSIEAKGEAKKDPNWYGFSFKFVSSTGAKTNIYQMFPVRRVDNFRYGPKKTLMIYQKLLDFLHAFGIYPEFETAMHTIGSVMQNFESLLGQKITVEIGYTGSYTQYVGKDGEQSLYAIIKQGQELKDEEGKELRFPGWQAAENYAKGIKLQIQGFPEVLKYYPADAAAVTVGEEADDELADVEF